MFLIKQHLEKVVEYIEKGNFEAAGSAYTYLFSKTKNWNFANEAGICFQKANMLSKASKAFKKALKTSSDRYSVLIHIGINYSLAMDFRKAREILEEVLYQTNNPRAAYELGKVAYFRNMWVDALKYLDLSHTYQLIQINSPDYPSQTLDANLMNLVFFYKAKIFGLELDYYGKACEIGRAHV